MQNKSKTRKFIRHPSDIPMQVSLDWVDENPTASHPDASLNNVSLGGLAIRSPQPLPVGQLVSISFPLLKQPRVLQGEVIWNRKVGSSFEIGLRFSQRDELFQLRMIEQICHIEHYRKEVQQHEGRELSSEQAAQEWIGLYASTFPSF